MADCVIRHRGPDSHFCSSSRYNTIELLWREVKRMVIQFYMNLFKDMERNGNMNIGNHLYILQIL